MQVRPIFQQCSLQAAPRGQGDQRLGAVVEVLAEHGVLDSGRVVEGEVEEGAGCHHLSNVGEALLDHLDRGMREHAVGVDDVEPIVGKEAERQIIDQCEARDLGLQAESRRPSGARQ
jgi:hypothetical protein